MDSLVKGPEYTPAAQSGRVDGRRDDGRTGSLQTGLLVLEILSSARSGLGVADLAHATGKDKGNLHRLLNMLADAGYVEQDADSGRYRVTPQVLGLAGSLLNDLDVLEVARPVMRDLRLVTAKTIHVAKRTRAGGIYIAQERPMGRLSVETEIGASVPIHCTATGKALYCDASRTELERVVRVPFEKYTDRTHQSFETLMTDLEEVRRRGYAIDDEEHFPDIRCVASPIFNARGAIVGSIGTSGHVQSITLEATPVIGAETREAADQITAALGGSVKERPD